MMISVCCSAGTFWMAKNVPAIVEVGCIVNADSFDWLFQALKIQSKSLSITCADCGAVLEKSSTKSVIVNNSQVITWSIWLITYDRFPKEDGAWLISAARPFHFGIQTEFELPTPGWVINQMLEQPEGWCRWIEELKWKKSLFSRCFTGIKIK